MQSDIKKLADILKIQALILFMSAISILSKLASNYEFLSVKFVFVYFIILFCFLMYAYFWQKILKNNTLFFAYSNRAMLPIYSLMWGVLIFSETITLNNIIGIILILVGILAVFNDYK